MRNFKNTVKIKMCINLEMLTSLWISAYKSCEDALTNKKFARFPLKKLHVLCR